MPLLSHDQILALHEAAIQCGLVDPAMQDTLLEGAPVEYVASLPIPPIPSARLHRALDEMNRVERLVDGTAPLEVWLKNALRHAKHLPPSKAFLEALDAIQRRSRPLLQDRGHSVPPPIRLLFLGVQGAPGEAVLDPGAAHRAIEHEIALAGGRDTVALTSGWAVQLPDVQRYLNAQSPHVVHFHAHGNAAGRLLLAWEGGRSMPVKPEALADLLRAAGTEVRLVFFNACHSEALAQAAVTAVDFAVGMAGAIEEKGATALGGAFYQAIASGCTVQRALDQAVAMLGGLGLGEQDKPRIFRRDGGPDPKATSLITKK